MLKLNSKNSDRVFIALMLLLPLTHFIVFWAYININYISLAFMDEVTEQFTLDNFTKFFRRFALDWQNPQGGLRYCIQNTFITAGMRMLLSMPLTVFASFVLFKKYFGHMFYRVVFYLPGIFGTVVCATMTTYVLDATGPIVKLGMLLGIKWHPEILISGLLNNNLSGRTTFFVTDVAISGGTVLLITGALQKVPKDIFDVGKMEGIGLFREFWYVVLPCCWSTIGIMWIMTFATVWGDYARPMLLTNGAYRTNNLAYYLFATTIRATHGEESYNYPAAIGLLMTGVVVPLTMLLRWISYKVVPPVEF